MYILNVGFLIASVLIVFTGCSQPENIGTVFYVSRSGNDFWSGIPLNELRADGGAVANRFLMQYQADILGVAVEIPAISEMTALGAAYLAGLSTTFWKSSDELDSKWQMAHRYEPGMSSSSRNQHYERWKDAVKRSLGWAVENN